MAGRLVQLTSVKAGISRLRTKGGADKDTLYDLLNGYVDASGAVQSRPGTVEAYVLPAGTVGMCSVNGGLTVFSHMLVPGMPAGITLEVLTHPADATQALVEIHFAGPFLGDEDGAFLYVVGEFADGQVFHYWLQRAETWAADTNYAPGDLVQPSVPNGYVYRATRLGEAAQPWAPNVARTVGDRVLPTAGGAYEHVVIDVDGANPRSGPTEPTWATSPGGITYEDADNAAPAPPAGGDDSPPPVPPRYGGNGTGGGDTSTDEVLL